MLAMNVRTPGRVQKWILPGGYGGRRLRIAEDGVVSILWRGQWWWLTTPEGRVESASYPVARPDIIKLVPLYTKGRPNPTLRPATPLRQEA